jgi:hypothetical protein
MKVNARLTVGVQEETGIEETFVEVDLERVRRSKGHLVADVELGEYDYLARNISMPDGTSWWSVDRLKQVY